MAGMARGRRAAGQAAAVQHLANPDRAAITNEGASMEDLVLPFGYPLETYPVETPDGFILRLYRIPHGVKNATAPDPNKPVVLLHHGITMASSCWVVLDPDSSAGFYLADAGFDVWMANARGNTYSRGNRYHRATDQGYWESSMDELALIDLPTQIDYILNSTGKQQLGFVGHSQGTTLPLMLLSQRREYNQKLWLMALLAPMAFAEDMAMPMVTQQARTHTAMLLYETGIGLMVHQTLFTQLLATCRRSPRQDWCFSQLTLDSSPYLNSADLPRLLATYPSTVSSRNLEHWSQLFRSATGLRTYDFGANCSVPEGGPRPYQETCNQAKYGQEQPPAYDLSKVTTKAAVFAGTHDSLAAPANIAKLLAAWNAEVVRYEMLPMLTHPDFLWARDPVFKPSLIKVLWHNSPQTS